MRSARLRRNLSRWPKRSRVVRESGHQLRRNNVELHTKEAFWDSLYKPRNDKVGDICVRVLIGDFRGSLCCGTDYRGTGSASARRYMTKGWRTERDTGLCCVEETEVMARPAGSRGGDHTVHCQERSGLTRELIPRGEFSTNRMPRRSSKTSRVLCHA